MIEVSLADAVNDSVNRLQSGQSVADCVALYPQYAAELESLLAVGGVVAWSQPNVDEAAQAEARGQFRFERALDEAWPQARGYRFSPLARWAASIALVFAFLAGGAGMVAENSLPGDTLYPVKLLTEDLRLALSSQDPATAAMFDARRLDEARAVIALGREAEMTLTGPVDSVTSNGIVIDGLLIQTDAGHDLVGTVVVVEVMSTRAGDLVARVIRPVDDSPITVPPLSPTETSTREPTNTALPTATHTLEPTSRPTTTQPPTERPTVTPSVTPVRVDQATDCAMPSGWVSYTVQVGDTLSALAARSGGSTESIASANCLDDASRIVVGQTIFLPRTPVPAPTMTDVPTLQRTLVREPTATPLPQRDDGQDSQRDGGEQRDSGSNTSGGGDRPRRGRGV